jgi:poly(A) polymerase
MLRAVVLAARLEFTIDPPVLDAIAAHRHEIARSAPARLVEEYYKILRSGHAEQAFRQLRETGLLKEITPELVEAPDAFWDSVTALDEYRARFTSAPDSMTNAVLAGTLLYPLGLTGRRRFHTDPLERRVELGMLPIARRDIERIQQILALQPRLLDIDAPGRAQRGVLHRAVLPEALTWLEIHGGRSDVVEHWRALMVEPRDRPTHAVPEPIDAAAGLPRSRRRRRRRRRRPSPQQS